MAFSSIKFRFEVMPSIDNVLVFSETKLGVTFTETFKNTRMSSFQTKIPTEHFGIYYGFISDYFKTAFDLDYNTANQYTVTSIQGIDGVIDYGTGEIIVTAKYPGAVFVAGAMPSGTAVVVDNIPEVPEIKILSATISEAVLNKCQNVKVEVSTDLLATKVLSPVVINPNINNPFTFDYARGQTINILVEDSNGKQANQNLVLPSLLNASNFNININNSPNGSTVIVESSNSSGLVLEYSLDNVEWQSSNVFSGLEPGDFTLYVRDQFGCSFNKPFTINQSGIYTPYFYISKANSIRFAKRDSQIYKTDENTLSCEVDVDQVYKEVQQFQSGDVVPTQFKSNYSSNVAKIIKEDLTEIIIPIEKKTSNIGIKDKRDARQYNIGSGKTGVFFTSGNVYDYDTDAVTGTYSLNGALPEWAVIGNYIVISNAWFMIEEIVFDESISSDVIVISQSYTGPEAGVIAGSVFNRFEYDVYEFSIDMADYIDQHFQVSLINTDSHFATVSHLSEEIWCKVKHDDCLEIKYYNTTNTDVFYATGIEFLIRIPITIIKGKPEEESENHKTDTNVVLLSAELYEGDEFVFEPVTKEIWRKLMISLSHEKVWLNGVGYVKNGSFSTEGPLEKSNLYVLTASMLKTGNVYNSQGAGNLELGGGEVEVPGLITTETGFVSYL